MCRSLLAVAGLLAVFFGSGTAVAQTTLLRVAGDAIPDSFGWSVGTVGDVDRDGFADLIVGAPEAFDVDHVDFGYARVPGTGTVGVRVWLDANRDGIINPSEDGIANATLRLYTPGPDGLVGNGDDVLVDTTTSDSNGY